MERSEPSVVTPMAFVSHASEDKARFVLPFATALFGLGIRAWVDAWEMQAGDSLPRKIFDEGIGTADAVVVVVSAVSAAKPWVREELDAATVRRISGHLRLIPIRLESAAMPEALLHIKWLDYPTVDAAAARTAAAEVAKIVRGVTDRPALGAAPNYAAPQPFVPGLTPVDVLVLREAVREALEGEDALYGLPSFDTDPFTANLATAGLSDGDVGDALEMLDRAGLVTTSGALGRTTSVKFRLTVYGMEAVIRSLVPDYEALHRRVGAAIVNERRWRSEDLAAAAGIPEQLVCHMLREWETRGWIGLSKEIGRGEQLYQFSVDLRRWLQA